MAKDYLIQLSPFSTSDFLQEYGEIFYQSDSLSNLIGITSTYNLLKLLENDPRVRIVRGWNELNYDI